MSTASVSHHEYLPNLLLEDFGIRTLLISDAEVSVISTGDTASNSSKQIAPTIATNDPSPSIPTCTINSTGVPQYFHHYSPAANYIIQGGNFHGCVLK
jgi:hypothetical protein